MVRGYFKNRKVIRTAWLFL